MARKPGVDGVAACSPIGSAAPLILRAKAVPVFALAERAADGTDAGAVHDMRVASRRLREALRLFAPLYPRRELKRWQRRVREVTRALGPVRDSDVFAEEFGLFGPELGEGGRRCVAFAIGRRLGRREAELADLRRGLADLKLGRRAGEFAAFAGEVRGADDVAEIPLADFARGAVGARVAVIVERQPAALVEANRARQHALRIDYKRLRYAVEVFSPCYGDAFDALHGTLSSFQDALGTLHDTEVFARELDSPGFVAQSALAGVAPADIEEVTALLARRARAAFAEFARLAAEHPAEELRDALLPPLSGVVEAPGR